MQWIATAKQIKELDRLAIEERGVPSVELMEHAARHVAEGALELAGRPTRGDRGYGIWGDSPEETEGLQAEAGRIWDSKRGLRAVVFCGPGNNGGDGVAAARFLREAGVEVRTILVGDRENMSPDCREMERRLAADGGTLESLPEELTMLKVWCLSCDVLVDALSGVGLSREVTGGFRSAVELMNGIPVPILAVDIPSGLESDTGRVLGCAVKAVRTVTFTAAKPGHYLGAGSECCGKVEVVSIGLPDDLTASNRWNAWAVEHHNCHLPSRRRDTHKGDYGKLYILAGCVGYTGAPVLCARGAVRAGAGLVTLGVPADIYPIVAVKCDEAMPYPLPADDKSVLDRAAATDAVLMGPGLGRSRRAERLVRSLLTGLDRPVVLDADGLNAISAHIPILDGRGARGALTVLTPHDGEFARLNGGAGPGEDRLAAARAFASAHGCILVLKGHRTITAFPDGTAFLNTSGNPGMAKGGSGDILAGVILSLLGQGLEPRLAVPAAVWVHGRAGDLCALEKGEYGMTPSDMVEMLPRALKELDEGPDSLLERYGLRD